MKYKSIPLPGDYAEAYPPGTTASQCQDCGEIRVSIPGDLTDEWKRHSDYCEPGATNHSPSPPDIPAHIPASQCRACANSGVGVCDDYPDCPAGRAAQRR